MHNIEVLWALKSTTISFSGSYNIQMGKMNSTRISVAEIATQTSWPNVVVSGIWRNESRMPHNQLCSCQWLGGQATIPDSGDRSRGNRRKVANGAPLVAQAVIQSGPIITHSCRPPSTWTRLTNNRKRFEQQRGKDTKIRRTARTERTYNPRGTLLLLLFQPLLFYGKGIQMTGYSKERTPQPGCFGQGLEP